MSRARWVLAAGGAALVVALAVAWTVEDRGEREPAAGREWGLTFYGAAPDSEARALALVRRLIAGHRRDGAAHGITSTRQIVPWDIALPPDPALGAAQTPPDRIAALDRWVTVMTGLGLTPMISFEHSISGAYAKDSPTGNPLPTPAQYRAAMTAFLARYPDAGTWDYTAWNEPNLATQPTARNPVRPVTWPAPSAGAPAVPARYDFGAAMAVRYLRELRGLCAAAGRSCRVLPGDFSGVPGFSWDRSGWYRTYRRFVGAGERLWAWHDYHDVTGDAFADPPDPAVPGGSVDELRAFMDAVPGAAVWVTEVGPIFFRGCDPRTRRRPCPVPLTAERQAAKEAALTRSWAAYVEALQRTPAVWDRLHGLTYYMVYGDPNWDSGLISRDGTFRAGVYAPLAALTARR